MEKPDWSALQFAPQVWEVWRYLQNLATTSPLGLNAILTTVHDWTGCDAVLLVSRQAARFPGEKTKWLLRRKVTKTGHCDWDKVVQDESFHALLDHLVVIALQAPGKDGFPTALVDFQSSYVLNPEPSHDDPAILALQELETAKLEKALFASLVEHTGGTIGLIKVYLLGYVAIGDWQLGETLLVMANELTDKDRKLDGVRLLDDMNLLPVIVTFSMYLAEVNSEFWRRRQVESLPLDARRKRLQADPEMERAYKRSVRRLMPMLGWRKARDLWQAIETLTFVSADAATEDEIGELKKQSLTCYYCSEDRARSVPETDLSLRQNRVRAVWLWMEILREVDKQLEGLRHIPRTGDGDVWAKHRAECEALIQRAADSLQDLPRVIWPGTNDWLRLDGPNLASFLLCKAVEHGSSSKSLLWAPTGTGLLEQLSLVRHVALVVLYSLGARLADMTTLESLLWLVCEIGHEALGLDRRIDLERHLQLAAMEEPALYSLKPLYRDHLNHVIQVCLAGWLLLEIRLGGETELQLWTSVAPGIGDGITLDAEGKKAVLRAWFLCSLLHDIGYVIDVGSKWARLLGMFDDSILSKLQLGITAKLEELSDDALTNSDWGYSKDDAPGEDHGVVSALHVRELLMELDKHFPIKDMDQAVLAMAHHNHWRPILNYNQEPLSAILVMVDELQEWDRPGVEQSRVGFALSAAIVHHTIDRSTWFEPTSSVSAYLHSRWDPKAGVLLHSNGSVIHFRLEYGEDVHRYDGIFAAWLGRTANLQRINLSKVPLDVRYELISTVRPPADLDRRNPDEPQLEHSGAL